uniref:Uncharacterized protein n=1 Tax=Anopheles minimus TaxID=112268 RepID=A0A182WPV7_9DIPT
MEPNTLPKRPSKQTWLHSSSITSTQPPAPPPRMLEFFVFSARLMNSWPVPYRVCLMEPAGCFRDVYLSLGGLCFQPFFSFCQNIRFPMCKVYYSLTRRVWAPKMCVRSVFNCVFFR